MMTSLKDEATQARVFVPQEPTRWDTTVNLAVPIRDFTPALKYGALVVCLPPGISYHMTAPIKAALRDKMAGMTEHDYIIGGVGAPVLSFLMAQIAIEKTGGKYNVLQWDKRQGEYMSMRIEP